MPRMRVLLFLCACLLIANAAGAQDGWMEWIEKMSGPSLQGSVVDIHAFCADRSFNIKACHPWDPGPVAFKLDDTKQIIDIRFGVYWNYGKTLIGSFQDQDSHHAFKAMGLYRYQPSGYVSVAVGAGYMKFYGFDRQFGRPVFTAASVTVNPFSGAASRIGRMLFFRYERTYYGKGLTDTESTPTTAFAAVSEWRNSVGFGFDFRRW
jgi:hypothetical protein